MKKIILILMLLLSITTLQAKAKGGATSGGGDLLGIDTSKIVSQVFDSIPKIGNKLYSEKELQSIEEVKNEIHLVMVDTELPTDTKGAVQNGAAFSIRENNKSTIFIKRDIWNNTPTLLSREVLIHHEIMVLSGIEMTGDYTYTLSYENLRRNFWKIAEIKNIFCAINIFKKALYYDKVVPGELIGSSSSLMPFVGAKADWGILSSRLNKALIWRGVIDSHGFFKMEIGEVKYDLRNANLPKEFSVDFGSIKVIEPMRVYVDPYQLINPILNPLVVTDEHVIVVNCNKLN